MRVFMLGWEFPPFISGGLGTACYGLTKALSRQNTGVTFVLPKTVDSDFTSHVKLLSPQAPKAAVGDRAPESVASSYEIDAPVMPGDSEEEDFENVSFKAVPSKFSSPYAGGASVASRGESSTGGPISFINPQASIPQPLAITQGGGTAVAEAPEPEPARTQEAPDYDGDLTAEAHRYANLCVDLARGEDFDVIHAHDWLTFPAGIAVARATGKPLIVHVHSTEYDRSGENVNTVVRGIEHEGCHAATRIIAVSRRTKSVLVERYDLHPDKIEVVYNGIENGPANPDITIPPKIDKDDKIVLFLGRVTMQKGPEYFIRAAKRVLEILDHVKFVVAGTGDKIQELIEMAARAGIGHKVVFTGFLRGDDVERVFKMADVYVMPSVSEPFGIAPLEAIAHDVPVIMSKQSGVSEVIEHALKVDFWDTDEMANKIVAVLRHPPLGATMREHADLEVRKLTWEGAAAKCHEVYESVV
ncbi:glycosyltransferase [Algisphaera agarilytica]|uniref:starch synthase n=1 Tax=Algisphaera agarilytica TaxID=1385975 RepID=A0A7X0LKR0_9BACT|nr:glycosyltransferase [Algisphaera agarilytica]MBB6430187.1 glycosyltransferase involved in cell wall biosynthesis [Algisphaera agarilytica]